jgi:putative endonuclease
MSCGPPWYVYLVRSTRNGHLYCGVTPNVQKRVEKHNSSKGAKWARANGPVELVWSRILPNRSVAQQAEHAIKRLSRSKKLLLVAGDLPFSLVFSQ